MYKHSVRRPLSETEASPRRNSNVAYKHPGSDVAKHLKSFRVRVFSSAQNTGLAISLCGGGQDSSCTILADEWLDSPWATKVKPGRWGSVYLLARVDFGLVNPLTSSSSASPASSSAASSFGVPSCPRTRCGMPSVVVCSVHLNNDYAKKPDVAKALLEPIFKRCVGERCLCIAGDFNQAAYDKSNGSPSFADAALRAAITELEISASYIRRQTDCIVAFVLSYDDEQPDFEYQVKQTRFDDMEARDLQLFPSDQGWHAPLLLTLRKSSNTTVRRRSTEGQGTRKKIKRAKFRARETQRASTSAAASVPYEGEPPSPVDDEAEHRPTDAPEQADLDQTGADRRRASGSVQTDTEPAGKRPRLRSPGRRTPRAPPTATG